LRMRTTAHDALATKNEDIMHLTQLSLYASTH
jgi:hypothetical protein